MRQIIAFIYCQFFSSHDSKTFASCGGDRLAFFWDSVSGRIIRQFQGHHLKINALAFNEDSSVLATGSDDRSVRLWDMRASSSRYPIQLLDDAKDSIGSVCIRGSVIAVGSLDGNVRLYDIRKGVMTSDNLTGMTFESLADINFLIFPCRSNHICQARKSISGFSCIPIGFEHPTG
jgi:WD40 repeat protein